MHAAKMMIIIYWIIPLDTKWFNTYPNNKYGKYAYNRWSLKYK